MQIYWLIVQEGLRRIWETWRGKKAEQRKLLSFSNDFVRSGLYIIYSQFDSQSVSWKWRTKKTVSICDTWGCCSSKNLRRETGLLLLICWLKRNVHFGFVFWLIFATVAYCVKEREYPKLHFRCKMRWFFSWTKRRRFLQTLVFEMVYNWTKKRVRRVRTWPAD